MSNYTAAVLFFSSLCQTQLNQPLSMLDAANDGLGATLVLRPEPRSFCAASFWSRTPCLLSDNLTCCFQAVMYAVSAVVSAYFFAMWKRADADVKSRVWRRYGWFSALAFFGSIGGLVTAAADIQHRSIFQRAIFSSRDIKCDEIKGKGFQWLQAVAVCYQPSVSMYAQMLNRMSVSPVPYAIEFLCICCVNLLVRLYLSLSARRRPPVSPLPA